MDKIRVLIVEDSPLAAKIIEDVLSGDSDIEVVGIARNGREAMSLVSQLKPDLITMDVVMPDIDGVEATKQIMAYHPTPILILSSSVFRRRMDAVFKAMSYGALDVMDKSAFEGGDAKEEARADLIKRVKMLSGIGVISHPLARVEKWISDKAKKTGKKIESAEKGRVIGIVASVGGTEAIKVILKKLPKEFTIPILVVQHMAFGFTLGFVEWLDGEVPIKVRIAEDGNKLAGKTVYVAPDGFQMKVTNKGVILLEDEPLKNGQKPSGTVLLKSIAEVYGESALGIILTGMGRDGAEGLKAIFEAGGYTIAQDEGSCVVYGMPRAAVEMHGVSEIVPLTDIADRILLWADK